MTPAPDGYGTGAGLVLDGAFHTTEGAIEGAPTATRFAVAAKVVTDANIRCQNNVPLKSGEHKVCGRLLARMASRPWEIECSRCHALQTSPAA